MVPILGCDWKVQTVEQAVQERSTQKAEYILSKEESERIRILKVWFTVMVVFIHSYTEEVHFTGGDVVLAVPVWLDWLKYTISKVISYVCVPGFFVISGLLLYRREFTWSENIKKKIKTILLPYLIINTAWIAIYFILQQIPASGQFFSNPENNVESWTWKEWLGAYTGIGRIDSQNSPFVYPLYFMRDLFALNLMAIILKRVIDFAPKITLAILAALFLFNVDLHIFCLGSRSLLFFCVGYYLVKYHIHLTDVKKIPSFPLAFFYILSVTLDCLTRDRPLQFIFRFFSILFGLLFFTKFTSVIRNEAWKRKILWCAKFTVPVYLFHEMNLSILRKLAVKILPQTAAVQFAEYFGIPAIIIALCIVFSLAFQKIAPKLYSVVTGGRTQ